MQTIPRKMISFKFCYLIALTGLSTGLAATPHIASQFVPVLSGKGDVARESVLINLWKKLDLSAEQINQIRPHAQGYVDRLQLLRGSSLSKEQLFISSRAATVEFHFTLKPLITPAQFVLLHETLK